MTSRRTRWALVITPLLVSCVATADAKPKGAALAAPAPASAALDRAEELGREARALDGHASSEESTAKFTQRTAVALRKRAGELEAEAATADEELRAALLAKAEAAELDAAAADARSRVYKQRAKAIRARASEVRALAGRLLRGEAAHALAAVDLPRPPPSHPNPAALRKLPSVSASPRVAAAAIAPFDGAH